MFVLIQMKKQQKKGNFKGKISTKLHDWLLLSVALLFFLERTLVIAQAQQTEDCFTKERFPKILEYEIAPSESSAQAITVNENLGALFVGG